MLLMCRDFQLFGTGDKLFLVYRQDDIETVGIINNPLVKSFSINTDYIDVTSLMGNTNRWFLPGMSTIDLNITGGKYEYITGKDLSNIYDPMMSKTILELLRGVDKKLKQRGKE